MQGDRKSWIVSIDMGYGHQRTAYALKGMAEGDEIISANSYKGIPGSDRNLWRRSRSFYEFISRFKNVPHIGDFAFSVYDRFQRIMNFYPKRDLSEATVIQKSLNSLFEKNWGRHLMKKLSRKPLPLVTTFFNVAFMAEYFNYPKDIYCVICDTDISRSWAPLDPQQTRIRYLASTIRSAERLELYGIRKKNIFLTGFPLPEENTKNAKKDLILRFPNLDPKKAYYKKYKPLIEEKLGRVSYAQKDHPLTILFSVGGAGAQTEIGIEIARTLKKKLDENEARLILSVGIKKEVKDIFKEALGRAKNVEIIHDSDFGKYFDKFNAALRRSDILWTKPSELSFYAQLGIPIIIAPEIGSQEKFNKRWLKNSNFGIEQKDPKYINDWLFDWINRGYLAEMAMDGYIKGERNGVKNIKKVVTKCSGS